MKTIGHLSLLLGMLAVVLGVGSYLAVLKIAGMEAHALFHFAQTCFLLTIAISLAPKVKSV